MKHKVSVLINTLNEEKNLGNCLESVSSWADEIIVVDMYSDDRTVEIAKRYGANVYMHERLGFADPARQFGLSKVKNQWVLVLDADEILSLKSPDFIDNLISSNQGDVYWIGRENLMFGEVIRYSGWGAKEDVQARLFNKEMLSYGSKIHDFVHISDDARQVRLNVQSIKLIHFNYLDISHFIEKMNRYTTIEAEQRYRSHTKICFLKAMARCSTEFIKRYFVKRGYLDGFNGFKLSVLMSIYYFFVYIKLKEIYKKKNINVKYIVEEEYKEVFNKYKSKDFDL